MADTIDFSETGHVEVVGNDPLDKKSDPTTVPIKYHTRNSSAQIAPGQHRLLRDDTIITFLTHPNGDIRFFKAGVILGDDAPDWLEDKAAVKIRVTRPPKNVSDRGEDYVVIVPVTRPMFSTPGWLDYLINIALSHQHR
jgi:hypothetical protein